MSDHVKLEIACTKEAADTLAALIKFIAESGNTGHSFPIVVDPQQHKMVIGGDNTFYYDGDGSSAIQLPLILRPLDEKTEIDKLIETNIYLRKKCGELYADVIERTIDFYDELIGSGVDPNDPDVIGLKRRLEDLAKFLQNSEEYKQKSLYYLIKQFGKD